MDYLKLIQDVNNVAHPTIKALHISRFIVSGLKSGELALYEAFLLNSEVIKFERLSYIQPAWTKQVIISNCIKILNQKLLATLFKDRANEKLMYELGIEAYGLCVEKRDHYIMNRYLEFLNIQPNSSELIEALSIVRETYSKLSDSNGPYHVEYFPYEYCRFENMLNSDKMELLTTDVSTWVDDVLNGLEE